PISNKAPFLVTSCSILNAGIAHRPALAAQTTVRLPLAARIVGFFAAVSIHAADWPRFLGPSGNGVSLETNLVDRIPNGGLPIVWDRSIGTGYGAPSVLQDQLVLHHRRGDDEIVESYEAVTGNPGWRHASPTRFEDPYGYNHVPRCAPLLTSERVYTFGAEGRLLCLQRANGARIWQ